MKKILAFAALTALAIVLLAGCNSESSEPDRAAIFSRSSVASDKGIYYRDERAYLKFFDYESGKNVYLCNKPECTHEEEDCYANCGSGLMAYYGDELYIVDTAECRLSKRKADGADPQKLISLCDKYSLTSSSMAVPVSGAFLGDKIYMTYDATVLNSEKGVEEKKAVLTCIDLNKGSEEIIEETNNSQYSIIDCKDGAVYLYEFHSLAKDGSLANLNNVNCILRRLDTGNNSISKIYEDRQIRFSPACYTNGVITFYKNNDRINELFTLSIDEPEPKPAKADYELLYGDERGDIVYDGAEDKYLLIKNGEKSDLPVDKNITAGFSYVTDDGIVLYCKSGSVSCENGTVTEQDNFYVSKDDFYAGKGRYYKVG